MVEQRKPGERIVVTNEMIEVLDQRRQVVQLTDHDHTHWVDVDSLTTDLGELLIAALTEPNEINDDSVALDQIAQGLRTPEWFVGMLEDIAQIVNNTGRSLHDEPDPELWWNRH